MLRDGKIIGSLDKSEFDPDMMKKMMVGREVKGDYYRSDYDGYSDEVVLRADCITTRQDLMCFDLELHKGEILGIGGLSSADAHGGQGSVRRGEDSGRQGDGRAKSGRSEKPETPSQQNWLYLQGP